MLSEGGCGAYDCLVVRRGWSGEAGSYQQEGCG